ncbi:hypothetical protein AAW14_06450 [Streptomyces hygroscopicus]|uniref:hypothetical protein n=1 Tax=Streptomyces hygroscopicus TaxID=1912 RepID=UPI0022402C1A|nr:hypothetical protein [Streptomyces hygroscopicus]MCW7941679.1 hypothetical protein [Streptomyces hygroscopicus]
MSAIMDELKHVVTTLEAEGHALAGKARSVLSHYEKEAAAVVDGVRPVLEELRTAVVADVKNAVADVEAAVAKVEALVKQPNAGS